MSYKNPKLTWFQEHDADIAQYLIFVLLAIAALYVFVYPTAKPHQYNISYIATIDTQEYNATWTINQGWFVSDSCILNVYYLRANSSGVYKIRILNKSRALEISSYAVTYNNYNYTKIFNCSVV